MCSRLVFFFFTAVLWAVDSQWLGSILGSLLLAVWCCLSVQEHENPEADNDCGFIGLAGTPVFKRHNSISHPYTSTVSRTYIIVFVLWYRVAPWLVQYLAEGMLFMASECFCPGKKVHTRERGRGQRNLEFPTGMKAGLMSRCLQKQRIFKQNY